LSTGAVRAPHLEGASDTGERVVVDLDSAGSTPILREYRAVKAQHPDHIVLGRMGDFYELLGGDAEIAAPILGVTLTSRNFGKAGRLPMCGVPHHAANGYIRKLLDAGQSVALWDQVGEVVGGKLVRREVTRVLTPGTRVDADYIDEGATARCCALNITPGGIGLASLDASTGELEYLEVDNDIATGAHVLADVCNRLGVAEIVVSHDAELPLPVLSHIHRTRVPQSYFDNARSADRIAQISPSDAETLRSNGGVQLGAVGAVLAYAQDLHLRLSGETLRLRRGDTGNVMQLDAATIRNLELLKPLNQDGVALLAVLDHTVTPMGARALRRLLVEPLTETAAIDARLAAVACLTDDATRDAVRSALRPVRDLERLLGRCAQAIASPRDLGAIRDALKAIPALHETVAKADARLLIDAAAGLCVPTALLAQLDEKLVDEPPLSARDGGAIRPGADAELDQMQKSSSGARSFIATLEESERARTGIKSLKVGYNRVFGYYIEVPGSQRDAVPAEYIRKQTLANAERFVTADLKDHETIVLSARERSIARELEILRECVEAVCAHAPILSAIAQSVTQIDFYQSLAHTARAERWVRPVVDESVVLDIEQGRHPVVERGLGPGRFVANDCTLDAAERIVVLTGPNMAGKSTYLRQVAVIVLLAQIGSFVPAKRARIGICDRIFTRVGAHDDLARGMSTFMLEMSETAHIVRNAGSRSLVVLDEIGRGTSTYDGLSIAQALVEYLHDAPQLNCRTLFATHYHELTALEHELPRVVNARVDVLESGSEVTFLHRIVPGGADRSYGIHVAKLAGLPAGVLRRAQVLLDELERAKPLAASESPNQLDLLVAQPGPNQPVVDELIQLDVESLTPIAALNKLAELREKLS
jgi:DNA mismatch repair protein MutS